MTGIGIGAENTIGWLRDLISTRLKHYPEQGIKCRVCAKCKSEDKPECEVAEKSAMTSDATLLPPETRFDASGSRTRTLSQPFASELSHRPPGDTVMKSGDDRDERARSFGAIAFEMEGAGVWDNLPCLVVSGV